MPVLINYLFKLSVSLAIVFLFYQLVLRRHTFYNWNRWFLLGYSMLSFIISFIDITPALEKNRLEGEGMIRFIPSFRLSAADGDNIATTPMPAGPSAWSLWHWMLLVLLSGALLLLLRLLVRYLSFLTIRRKASLISSAGVKLYQVDGDIIPFSFGNAIFINQQLHSTAELQEIIRHEFVHVRQKHTYDIILAELLCILNWYNPFAWLIRSAIRQNLEFIADHKVLQSGLDRKQYQYLLLKVIGNNHFSIASQFNFSSLKKRIAMMNKMRSAKAHLLKFLFLLPLIAAFLLAFRNTKAGEAVKNAVAGQLPARVSSDTSAVPGSDTLFWKGKDNAVIGDLSKLEEPDVYGNRHLLLLDGREVPTLTHIDKSDIADLRMLFAREAKKKYGNRGKYGVVEVYTTEFLQDSLPDAMPNRKGYSLTIRDNNGNCMVVVKDRNKKEVERMLLTQWDENKAYYEGKYGMILPPPPPVEPPPPPAAPAVPAPPVVSGLPDHVKSIRVNNDHAVVVLKNGDREKYDLAKPQEKEAFQKKYGKSLPAPPAPPAVAPAPPRAPSFRTMTIMADSIVWTSRERTLSFSGKAIIDDNKEKVTILASFINLQDDHSLVMINGKEAAGARDYTNYKGGTYRLKSLSIPEALKKYGEKGKKGALEINEITSL